MTLLQLNVLMDTHLTHTQGAPMVLPTNDAWLKNLVIAVSHCCPSAGCSDRNVITPSNCKLIVTTSTFIPPQSMPHHAQGLNKQTWLITNRPFYLWCHLQNQIQRLNKWLGQERVSCAFIMFSWVHLPCEMTGERERRLLTPNYSLNIK